MSAVTTAQVDKPLQLQLGVPIWISDADDTRQEGEITVAGVGEG